MTGKNKKHVLALLLSASLALAGCGAVSNSGNGSAGAGSSDASSLPTEETSAEETADAAVDGTETSGSAEASSEGGTGTSESAGTSSENGSSGWTGVTSEEDGVPATSVTEEMINIKDGDYETDWEEEDPVTVTANGTSAEADGAGVSTGDGTITITAEGTYVLTGTFEGTVTVDTGDEDAKVRLVLDGFTITSTDGPAILALTADKVTITTADGTENTVSDSTTYTNADYDAAIMSKTDLVLNGGGTLVINGIYKDAVHSTDDLRITGGSYEVSSVDDAFVGKDRLEITGGTFDVTTSSDTGDAFKSTNDEEEEKGFIYISGGDFTVRSGDEAFQSAADMLVTGGTFSINASGKGFHADDTLEFTGGDVTISTCYEGLESPVIIVRDGTLDITATDDGINAAGGGETSEDSENETGTGDGAGNRMFGGMESSSTGYLYITGGTIHIDAAGDGIDSNTSVTQTGGDITVDGPVADMDGALDYDETYDISGGTLFAVGSSGMLQTVSETSSENCLAMIFTDRQSAGSTITITDSDGTVVASFTPSKEYASFVYASPDLVDGATYTVLIDGTKITDVTLDGTVTLVNDSGSAASGGQAGGWTGGFGMHGRTSGNRI